VSRLISALRGRAAAIALVAALLVAGAAVGAVKLLTDRVDNAIPQTDLFGSDTPSVFPGTTPAATPSPTVEPGLDIKGPLNILIVGVDTRVTVASWIPRSDAIMIMHISADHTKAYLTSLPRDLVVTIPAFTPARFGGSHQKINAAMAFGSRVPGSNRANYAQGFQLLAKTVSMYTGIARFDAGAILTFGGLRTLVDQLGGIDMTIDQRVVSIHMRPDGKYRTLSSGAEHGYVGPQMTYNPGPFHMKGWQALDYSRQRYTAGGDYTRQRHQRQVIKAIVTKLFSLSVVTDPLKLDRVVRALGKALTFDGRGHRVIDFAFALKNIRPANITMVGLPGSGVYSGGSYIGEALAPIQSRYFAALRQDKLDSFLAANPGLVHR